MPRGKPGLLELLQPTALPAPQKEVDNGPVPDTTDAPNLPVFGLDSLDNRLIITPEKQVPDNGIITLQINQQFTSLTPQTLVIDQSDPTDVKFSASGGGGVNVGNLFGSGHCLWVQSNQLDLKGGSTIRQHPYVTYNSISGDFSINRTGIYLFTISGKINNGLGTYGATSAQVVFTPENSTVVTGLPEDVRDMHYVVEDTEFQWTRFTSNAVLVAINGSEINPHILLNGSWSTSGPAASFDITVSSIYGPGSLAETQWQLTKSYRREGGFYDGSGPYGYTGFEGAPYGTNGSVPPHDLSSLDAYFGDPASPLWYPDSQMYLAIQISPNPDLIDGSISYQVQSWEGAMPDDIEIGITKFNFGNGVAEQGIYVRLPRTGASYVGTSFKILLSATDIITNHPIYFKYSAEGQNGCESVGFYDFAVYGGISSNDGTITGASVYSYNMYNQNGSYPFWEQFFMRQASSTYDRNIGSVHFSLAQGTLWKLPSTVTWDIEWLGAVRLTSDPAPNNWVLVEPWQLVEGEPSSPPSVTYWPNVGDVDDWAVSPVGHWQLRQAMNQDYWFADPNWAGYPTLEAPDEFIPALYRITFYNGAELMNYSEFTMGFTI